MKININRNNLKKVIGSGVLTLSLVMPLTGCSQKNISNDQTNDTSSNIEFKSGEHKLIKVEKELTLYGKEGSFRLKAPEGYEIVDYDYDYDSSIFAYNDYYYRNTSDVTCCDVNSFGEPLEKKEDKDICDVGEHSIVNLDRRLTLMGDFSLVKDLTSPEGYEIVDYDYDVCESLEFENITYRNSEPVKLENENKLGTVINSSKKEDKDYYDVGEHYIVSLDRSFNPLFGKNETKTIYAPEGYEILDYDYDKLPSTEYETILYRNIVPVTKEENNFGKVLEDVNYVDEALVEINRNLNIFIGFDKLKQVSLKDGFDLIDYDYDKNEGFEFETYVYKRK